jgi:hypothetical protein
MTMRRRVWGCSVCALAVFAFPAALPRCQSGPQAAPSPPILSKPVASFRVDGLELIGAIVQLAKGERIALAIEYANPDDLAQRVTVKLGPTTVGQVLDALLPRSKGYSVRVQSGVVHLLNKAVTSRRPTLLDRVIPEFSVTPHGRMQITVVMASGWLVEALERLLYPWPKSPGHRPMGIAGSGPVGLMQNQIGPLKLRNKTVRQILDRLVSEHHNSAWIIVVPPDEMDRLPHNGPFFYDINLWDILEYDRSQGRWSDGLLPELRSHWGIHGGSY